MYGIEEGGYIGELFSAWSADDSAIARTPISPVAMRYGSDWYFQMVFCATTAVHRFRHDCRADEAVAVSYLHPVPDRLHLPIVGSWEWGTGWLDAMGFSDFAGLLWSTRPAAGLR